MSNNTINALLIDDDKLNLEVLHRFLTHEGITCTSVQDIKNIGAAITAPAEIDLVFLDLEMPRTNGYEVFTMLRKALGKTVPIVACTVHLNEISNVRVLGFDGFISKPLDQQRFPAQVRRILQGEQVWE